MRLFPRSSKHALEIIGLDIKKVKIWYSWDSRDVVNFTGGQLLIDTQSLEGNNFSLFVLPFCLAANMCNFVRFVDSSTV